MQCGECSWLDSPCARLRYDQIDITLSQTGERTARAQRRKKSSQSYASLENLQPTEWETRACPPAQSRNSRSPSRSASFDVARLRPAPKGPTQLSPGQRPGTPGERDKACPERAETTSPGGGVPASGCRPGSRGRPGERFGHIPTGHAKPSRRKTVPCYALSGLCSNAISLGTPGHPACGVPPAGAGMLRPLRGKVANRATTFLNQSFDGSGFGQLSENRPLDDRLRWLGGGPAPGMDRVRPATGDSRRTGRFDLASPRRCDRHGRRS